MLYLCYRLATCKSRTLYFCHFYADQQNFVNYSFLMHTTLTRSPGKFSIEVFLRTCSFRRPQVAAELKENSM